MHGKNSLLTPSSTVANLSPILFPEVWKQVWRRRSSRTLFLHLLKKYFRTVFCTFLKNQTLSSTGLETGCKPVLLYKFYANVFTLRFECIR